MQQFNVLGMMSGTSLDGLDLAYCTIWKHEGIWHYKIHKAAGVQYSAIWKSRLKNAIQISEEDHEKLHIEYGLWLGEQAYGFLNKNNLEIDFIASHGHTSHHRPEEGFTFQLGDGQQLANVSEQKVICDFRSLDVILGGQGAPLVPIGDELLFSDYEFCLNLGGISNISFKKDAHRIAYDIGLSNMPLNHVTQKIGLEYDEDGNMARSGKLIPELLNQLNALEYYNLPYPKSTGYEWFLERVLPLLENSKASTADLLHTLIHHNCIQIANEIQKNTASPNSTMLVCGGGALNSFFMQVLQEKLGDACKLHIPDKQLINYKEALVFALMGVLKEKGEVNVLKSVTGATKNSISGAVFLPNP